MRVLLNNPWKSTVLMVGAYLELILVWRFGF